MLPKSKEKCTDLSFACLPTYLICTFPHAPSPAFPHFLRRGWGLYFPLPCTSDLLQKLPSVQLRSSPPPYLEHLTPPEQHIFFDLGPGMKGRSLPDRPPPWIQPLKPSASHAHLRLYSPWVSYSSFSLYTPLLLPPGEGGKPSLSCKAPESHRSSSASRGLNLKPPAKKQQHLRALCTRKVTASLPGKKICIKHRKVLKTSSIELSHPSDGWHSKATQKGGTGDDDFMQWKAFNGCPVF